MKDAWDNDAVQFARLLAEIRAAGLNRRQIVDIATSMDITSVQLHELLDRAERVFEAAKDAIAERMDASEFVAGEDGFDISVTVNVSIPVSLTYDADNLPTRSGLRSHAISNFLAHPAVSKPEYANVLTDYVLSIDLPSGDKV